VLEVCPGGVRVAEGTSDPETHAAEIVVLATGLRASRLAEDSGLGTTPDGRLTVDVTLRSPTHPGIWGAGDAAAAMGADGAPLRMGCATAMPQAAHVADAILADLAGEPAPPFRFDFFMQCVSLGRRRGLVQRVNARDEPEERVASGRLGAWLKELVCRFSLFMLHLERRRPGTYAWPGAGRAAPVAKAPRAPANEPRAARAMQ
jgi:NADH:ubiquinone reductase (H+-translocating)